MQNVDEILDEIGLSPAERAVYLALLDGAESVKDIMNVSSEKRPTVYYSLNSLEKMGLVSKTGKEYGNKFQVEPVENLLAIVEKNIRKQEQLLEQTKKLAASYTKQNAKQQVSVSYFDTEQSIKSAILGSLYNKTGEIKTIVPADNFFADVGAEFIKEYVAEKKRRNIKTKALWESIPTKEILEKYYRGSQIRQLPVCMHNDFEMIVFIYDDKVLYIAPKKESYALLVQSCEQVRLMNSVFGTLWVSADEITEK